jgi:hypothetical protein
MRSTAAGLRELLLAAAGLAVVVVTGLWVEARREAVEVALSHRAELLRLLAERRAGSGPDGGSLPELDDLGSLFRTERLRWLEGPQGPRLVLQPRREGA